MNMPLQLAQFTKRFNKRTAMFQPVHPGIILLDYFDPAESIEGVARILGTDVEYAKQLLKGRPTHTLTRIMCVRLAHKFDTSVSFWVNMQKEFDNFYITHNEHNIVADLIGPFEYAFDSSDRKWTYTKPLKGSMFPLDGVNLLPMRQRFLNPSYPDRQFWYANEWKHEADLPAYVETRTFSPTQ